MATTNMLEFSRKPIATLEWPTTTEFRAARTSDDLAELFNTVDREDQLRALAAYKLDLLHQAETQNADIAQQREEILADAGAELRRFVSNLAATLDATAERRARLDLEMHEAGFAWCGPCYVDAHGNGHQLAGVLLSFVADEQT